MNPVSTRLLSQQLAAPQFKEPAEVVSWFGAIQAQDYRAMRWAVAMRTGRPSFSAFKSAFDEGRILRAHLLRGTWQLVSAGDYHWMRALCHDKGMAVLDGWTRSLGFSYSGREKERILTIIEDTVAGKGEVTEDVIGEALLEGGIPRERLLYNHQLRMAELEGLVCSGSLGPRNTYRLVRDRAPMASPLSREESLALLARKYFRSHGPATLEDFTWWSGLTSGDCRRGIASLGDELRPQRWKGRDFYIHRDSRTRGVRGGVLLLPAYDEYLIGYKSREIVLHPDHAHHAHNDYGIFKSVVAWNGEIVGNWKPSSKDGGVSLFKEGLVIPEEAVGKAIGNYHTAQKK
jgi:hypothetical protein